MHGESADESSVWHHYRRLLELRDDEPVLVYGEYDLLLPDDEQVYGYTRTLADERMPIVLDRSDESVPVDIGNAGVDLDRTDLSVWLSNYEGGATDPDGWRFRPYETVVYRYRSSRSHSQR